MTQSNCTGQNCESCGDHNAGKITETRTFRNIVRALGVVVVVQLFIILVTTATELMGISINETAYHFALAVTTVFIIILGFAAFVMINSSR
jgi:hypothetical protein